MNTAEKVARLEAYLKRLQTNAKLPRPRRGASGPLTDVVALAGAGSGDKPSPMAEAARLAASQLEANRVSVEQAVKEASERAARDIAESAAAARAASLRAEKDAADRAARETAERAAKEAAAKAEKEAVAKAASERLAKEAADKAEKEAAAKAAAERVAKEAATKAAKEAAAKAEKEASERVAKEAAAKAEKEAAERVAKEKAAKAEKDAADKAAKEKAAKEAAAKDAAAKEAAAKEKAAADKAMKDAAEKVAKEKAAKEATERATREATERAARDAAKVPAKKEPATIDELFAELELGGGDTTKIQPAVQVTAPSPKPSPVRAAPPPLPEPIKDETTMDGDLPTVVGSMDELSQKARGDAELPTRVVPPALPMDAPTRVAEPYAGLLDPPTIDGPTIVFGPTPLLDRSPEPDEPTVVRRPTAQDQALVRGEAPPDASDEADEEATVVRQSVEDLSAAAGAAPVVAIGAPKQMTIEELIEPTPIIAIGDVDAVEAAASSAGASEDKSAPKSATGLHEPKVELAEPLREAAESAAKAAAESAARAAAEKAEREAALQPKPERREPVREEITTASRRMADVTPETIAAQQKEREREDRQKKKKGWGGTVGLLAATILLVGGVVLAGLRNGWFESSGPPAPTSGASGAPTGQPPRTSPTVPTSAPRTTQSALPTVAPTTSVSAVPSLEPTAPGINPAAADKPGVPVVERNDETNKLNTTKGFLTLVSPEEGFVYVTGKKIGAANKRHEVTCGVGLVRFGVPLPNGGVDWRSPPGMSIPIPCRASTTVAITPSAGPWKAPGSNRLPVGGGEDPY